jgi:chromosome partitioning protein
MPKDDPTIVSFVNLKGGVGKTALAVNFAAYCGLRDKKTLLIDLDPQTNATLSCISVESWQEHAKTHGTVADLLGLRHHTSAEGKKKEAAEVLIKGAFRNVDLLPSHLDLFTIDLDLGSEPARERILKRSIKDIVGNYDVIVCDCPPNLTLPTQSAIAISTHYVVPVSPDFLSSLGVALLLTRINKISDALENPIQHAGIVMSRVGRPSSFRQQTTETLRKTFPGKVLTSELKERSGVSESAAKNVSIFEWKDADAKKEFIAFGEELTGLIGLR